MSGFRVGVGFGWSVAGGFTSRLALSLFRLQVAPGEVFEPPFGREGRAEGWFEGGWGGAGEGGEGRRVLRREEGRGGGARSGSAG